MKSRLFYIAIILIAALLVIFSLSTNKRSNAIMASVESQKTAISFQKPVKVKALHVSDGQHVKKGQILLEVERPDLLLDRAKLDNNRRQEQAKKKKLLADYQSKLRLLEIEVSGKSERLQSEMDQIQAEIRYQQSVYSSIRSLANTNGDSSDAQVNEEQKIRMSSLHNEIKRLDEYHRSERSRYKILLDEDLSSVDLNLEILDKEEETLNEETATLKRVAPFDGTIGNVNAQLLELIRPYETIISLFEVRPSMIKAHLNLEAGQQVAVGQSVKIESSSREYSTTGEIVEIGSRIVSYRDPSLPLNIPEMFGREIFIKLPEDNTFLYGEQVLVFVTSN